MKLNKKIFGIGIVLVGLWTVWHFWQNFSKHQQRRMSVEEVSPTRGDIELTISTTGTVQPQNRLEVKPPINGRIEEIPVQEGDLIKKGQILARMSSTDRAALLDAARSKGQESMDYWEDVYKPTSLIAPIDGEVIVRSVEPGQTLTSNDPVVVLSDRLIVKAQVDETDIGGVEIGQKAVVSLDAYPKEKVSGKVDHISYESKVVSNVTIYEVDIVLEEIPKIFRSGMSANIEIVKDSRQNVLRLPMKAVKHTDKGDIVFVKDEDNKKPMRTKIETGIANDEFIEIKNGIDEHDVILIQTEKSSLPRRGNNQGGSPFMPSRQSRGGR